MVISVKFRECISLLFFVGLFFQESWFSHFISFTFIHNHAHAYIDTQRHTRSVFAVYLIFIFFLLWSKILPLKFYTHVNNCLLNISTSVTHSYTSHLNHMLFYFLTQLVHICHWSQKSRIHLQFLHRLVFSHLAHF